MTAATRIVAVSHRHQGPPPGVVITATSTKDSAATPYWWALLNQSPLAPLSLAVSAALVVVGMVLQWSTPGPPR